MNVAFLKVHLMQSNFKIAQHWLGVGQRGALNWSLRALSSVCSWHEFTGQQDFAQGSAWLIRLSGGRWLGRADLS